MAEQGDAYSTFIDDELQREYDRKTAIEARGLAIATQSSAFLTLVLAVTALITGKDYDWSRQGVRGLLVAVAPLALAVLLGFFANASRAYKVANLETLQRMIGDHWVDHEVDARNSAASQKVETINSLRVGTNRKAGMVVVAFSLQLTSLIGLLATVLYELRTQIL